MQHMQAHTARQHKRAAARGLLLLFLFDILLAGFIVGGDYLVNYRIPHRLSALNASTTDVQTLPLPVTGSGQQSAGDTTASGSSDWGQKFQDKFSDTVVSTGTVYKSPNISVEITQHSYDSETIGLTSNGKHSKYGTQIYYTLADIYVRDISCLRTAFAQDTYGVGFYETLSSMSERMKSILAVNGDSYSNNRHYNNGTIIRNGIVYRAQPTTDETCVLFRDGTMKIYGPDELDPNQLIADGAWQSRVFGPSLLDAEGNAKTDFLTWDYIRESHPRTAIGYYEPGHYCLLVVDGRQPGLSRGMFLEEMSQLFADLGYKAAYNLDGGHCAFMTRDANVISKPYRPSKDISNGIFICEPEA